MICIKIISKMRTISQYIFIDFQFKFKGQFLNDVL